MKKYKQQIGNLEKQLASSKTECEGLESTCRTIREELICKRKLIQDMIRGDCEQMNLRLSISKLSIKPK